MPRKPKRRNIKWSPIIKQAREIAEASSVVLTLRALFYRLVAEELIPNRQGPYKYLSELTAQLRRAGEFPALSDPLRVIRRPWAFDSPTDAREWLAETYRRDRTEGQPYQVVIVVEKATVVGYLTQWFDHLGVPIAALRGYTSQTYVDEIAAMLRDDNRDAVILYAGDFDPSGQDISRDFLKRLGADAQVHPVALDWTQVVHYGLPPQLGKATDSRASAFEQRHGRLVQVELEALDPGELERLFREALANYWDDDAYEASLRAEADDREELRPDA